MLTLQQKSKRRSKLKAFSLLETVISIAILGVILFMVHTTTIRFAELTQKAIARSTVREEVTNISDQIVTDVRSALQLGECNSVQAGAATCTIINPNQLIRWSLCNQAICRTDINANQVLFQSSSDILINRFDIEAGVTSGNDPARSNILVTIVASHRNPKYQVTNIVRQISISTRNYVIR
jgi:hypothetical protein